MGDGDLDDERGDLSPEQLRLTLHCEHLGRDAGDVADLLDPAGTFAAFAASASRLDQWHSSGKGEPRPPGQLRPYAAPQLRMLTRAWATPPYRMIYDPDGRSMADRVRRRF